MITLITLGVYFIFFNFEGKMSRKTNEFLIDVTAFLLGFIAMGIINLF